MKLVFTARALVLPLAAMSLLLQGCAGGNGGDGEDSATVVPAKPEVTLTPVATKTYAFRWSDVSEESEYRLLENPDEMSGYSEVAVIPANSTDYDHIVSLPKQVNTSYILQACNSLGCTDSDEMFVSGSLAEAVGFFKASNAQTDDLFGYAVALSANGQVMAVGAPEESSNATGVNGDQTDNSMEGAGAVYVFTRDDGVWTQQAYLKASNRDSRDYFGIELALSADGRTLVVASPNESSAANGIDGDQSDNSARLSGAVYVFTQDEAGWSQQAYIKASNAEINDEFGTSVALSADGKLLAVGAYAEGSSATGIDGDQANNDAPASGAVYVFGNNGGAWSQQAYIKASNAQSNDYFGDRITLSADGGTLAVGAYSESSAATGIDGDQSDNTASHSGAVYVFAQAEGIWSQQAYMKASNAEDFDFFGETLALSADGDTLAVGATGEDSAATGIDGDQFDNTANTTGAVYVYRRSSDIWSQHAYIKASNSEAHDNFGTQVALSGDGTVLAVGASYEDSGATGINGDQPDNSVLSSGATYVFIQRDGVWSQQAYIKAPNAQSDDAFGISLALSGDGETLAVGASFESSAATGINGDRTDNSATDSGAVYLY